MTNKDSAAAPARKYRLAPGRAGKVTGGFVNDVSELGKHCKRDYLGYDVWDRIRRGMVCFAAAAKKLTQKKTSLTIA